MAHGGKRAGAGRKSKAEEQKLIERLSPLADTALQALERNINDDQGWAVKMFFEYFYGKPVERQEHSFTDTPTIRIEYIKDNNSGSED